MVDRLKALGAGLEDAGRHFVKHEQSTRTIAAAKKRLKDKGTSTFTKARLTGALALYIARKASPIGLAQNTYSSIKEGMSSYNAVRSDQYEAAIEEVVGPLDPHSQQAIRNAMRNTSMNGNGRIVLGNQAQNLFTDFELGLHLAVWAATLQLCRMAALGFAQPTAGRAPCR